MSITWNTYQQQALSTAIYPLKRELEYTVLGLCSEVGEIGEAYDAWRVGNGLAGTPEFAHLLDEIGDNFWYCAAVSDALKYPLAIVALYLDPQPEMVRAPLSVDKHLRDITREVSAMAGVVKKAIRDNDGFLSSAGQDKIALHLFRTIWLLDALCDRFGTSRHIVMVKNLNKLADRKQRGVLQGSGDNR
jgi:NTP pyrophosphatase (non-canonical NTP hydrolase)